MRGQLAVHTRCPECGSTHIVMDTGEFACGACGLVIQEEVLDRSPEWRAFTLEERENKRRVGAPTDYSRYDKGLSTSMWVSQDAFGRQLPAETKSQMWRLRRWQVRSQMRDKGRNLMQAMNEIERLSEKLHVPAVIRETAAVIYRKALDADLVRGRSITSIAAAALYAACRLTETPKTLKEIVDASLRERGEISRCYRMIIRMLRIKMPVPDPIDYVSKIAEKAGVSNDTQGVAVNIILEAKRRRIIAGKDPVGVAAAALYIASRQNNERITQRGIAEAAKVTEVTIRNRKEELVKTLNLKIDKTSR